MKNLTKSFNIITFAAIFSLIMAGCGNPKTDPQTTDPGGGPIALTGTISISGIAQTGQVLTANTSDLGGNGTISYQWKRGDTVSEVNTVISGAASSTYTLETDDESKFIKVTVTRSGNSGSVDSGAVGPVLPAQAETPTVTSVTLAPASASVLRGATQNFTATVEGTNNPPQTVIWSVDAPHAEETSIADDGTLTVAAGETAATLTVRAASTFDNSKSGTATVTVIYPTVTSVTVSPTGVSVHKGETRQFTATVNGTNSPAQTVTWSVTGGVSGTTIANDGTLTVAFGQPAGDAPTLTVRATSTVDNTKSGMAMVTVTTPPLTGSVTITGNAQEGRELTANTENLAGNGNGAISYQWKQGNGSLTDPFTDILGATSSTYIVVTADIGKYISVTVTRAGYEGSKTASAVGPITAGEVPTPTVTSVTVNPTTADVLKGGTQQFTATVTGTNSPPQTVTWTVSGGTGGSTAINTSGLLTVSANETSATLTVKATSTIDTTKSATATVTVPALTGTVSINGTAIVGQDLTAVTTSLNGSGTISYQWTRGDTSGAAGTNISGATSSTYKLVTADAGKYIKVTVTRAGYRDSVTSNATDKVTFPALTGTVSISGTTAVGSVLTANTSLGGSGTITYQWKRGNTSSDAGTDISGATSSTYTLLTADDGKYIKVTVTRSENTGSVNSNTLGPITLPALSGTVSITGTTTVGQTLTANTSLGGSGTTTYQWKRSTTQNGTFNNISGATSSTYTLVPDDNAKYLIVTVTRSGNSGSVDSPVTAQVTQPAETVVSSNVNGSTAFNGLTTPASTYDVVNLPPESKTNVMKVIPGDKWAVAEYSLSAYKNKEIKITLSVNVKRVGAAGTLQWQVNNTKEPAYPVVASVSNAAVNTWHSMSETKTLTPTADYPSLYLNNDKSNPGSTYYIDNFTISIVETSTGGGGGAPNITTTPLNPNASGVQTFTSNSGGNKPLSGSTYGYEMWTEGGNNNKLLWYGPNQGGGAAFRAEWNNPNDFLGRIGYYWGNGGQFTQYKNMYADFNYTRSGKNTAGNYSYIGIYGWARNPGASNADERLIEYYIVEDWFGNQWQDDTSPMGTGTTGGSVVGSYTLDGATYSVIKNVRVNKPSIDGDTTFTQYFSIRQTLRKTGTISITEHFKKWDGMNMKLGNMYEAKFLVEAGGGTGWLEFTYLRLSQEDNPR